MPVFESEEEFLQANETDDDRREREAREAKWNRATEE